MNSLGGTQEAMAESFKLKAVVDIPGVGRASAVRDDPAFPKQSEMIGDQVGALSHEINQFVHPAVAARKLSQKLPPKLVCDQPQEVAGLELLIPCRQPSSRLH
jgi:hypothetical protein